MWVGGLAGSGWATGGKSHHAREATNSAHRLLLLPQDRPKMLAILPAWLCEQPTTRNKSEIVTIHTDFHHATFPPISSPREKPRGRDCAAHHPRPHTPKSKLPIGRRQRAGPRLVESRAEFPAQKRRQRWVGGGATRLGGVQCSGTQLQPVFTGD